MSDYGIDDYLKDKKEARADKLQTYVERQINQIADLIAETERELTDKDYGYFKSELGDYINEI